MPFYSTLKQALTPSLIFALMCLLCRSAISEQLCTKEDAYLAEQAMSTFTSSSDCSINSNTIKAISNAQYYIWGVESPQINGAISIDRKSLSRITQFPNQTPIVVLPNTHHSIHVAHFCSRLKGLHPEAKILLNGVDFLFEEKDVWLTKETAIELIAHENVILYEKNIKIDSSMTYVVVSDELLNYKGRLLDDPNLVSLIDRVFFVQAFKEEVESHARLLRLAREKKKTIPNRYRCR